MRENFRTPTAYKGSAKIIKRVIIEGLPAHLKDILLRTDPISDAQEKIKRQNALKLVQRISFLFPHPLINILMQVNRLFSTLGQDIYGLTYCSETIPEFPDGFLMKRGRRPSNPPNPSSITISSPATTGSDPTGSPPITVGSAPYGIVDQADESDDDNTGPQPKRPKFVNKKGHKARPQDLFETKPEVALLAVTSLATLAEGLFEGRQLKDLVIYEPACGNGAIVKEFEKIGTKVIARDLYTTEEKHDYLKEMDPDYDIMVTNPPFRSKFEFAKKAFDSKKPFVMLLPLSTLSTKKWMSMFKHQKVFVQMLSRCDFMHDGKDVSICECVWLYGNCGQDSCSFEYYIMLLHHLLSEFLKQR